MTKELSTLVHEITQVIKEKHYAVQNGHPGYGVYDVKIERLIMGFARKYHLEQMGGKVPCKPVPVPFVIPNYFPKDKPA